MVTAKSKREQLNYTLAKIKDYLFHVTSSHR
jgi:hypothetical protein